MFGFKLMAADKEIFKSVASWKTAEDVETEFNSAIHERGLISIRANKEGFPVTLIPISLINNSIIEIYQE